MIVVGTMIRKITLERIVDSERRIRAERASSNTPAIKEESPSEVGIPSDIPSRVPSRTSSEVSMMY